MPGNYGLHFTNSAFGQLMDVLVIVCTLAMAQRKVRGVCRAQLTKQASVFRFLLSQYLLADLGATALLLARNILYAESCNSPANLLPGQSFGRN
jgi:hypothetical protein